MVARCSGVKAAANRTSCMEWRKNICVCGGKESAVLFEAGDICFHTTEKVSGILQCSDCQSLFPEAFPNERTLSLAYENYYTERPKPQDSWLKRLLRNSRRMQSYTARCEDSSVHSLLDYGCGSGAFLAAAKAPEKYGVDVAMAPGDFTWLSTSELAKSELTFDLITLGHSLEHISDPDAVLGVLASKLAPGGRLWIATPNAKSFLITIFRELARDIDFPRHRIVFSREALAELCSKHGLNIRFERSPRLNGVMNLAYCASVSRRRPIRTLRALLVMMAHMIAPSLGRDPEIVAIATAKAPVV
jgi:SAM-dependent methyltransferase